MFRAVNNPVITTNWWPVLNRHSGNRTKWQSQAPIMALRHRHTGLRISNACAPPMTKTMNICSVLFWKLNSKNRGYSDEHHRNILKAERSHNGCIYKIWSQSDARCNGGAWKTKVWQTDKRCYSHVLQLSLAKDNMFKTATIGSHYSMGNHDGIWHGEWYFHD